MPRIKASDLESLLKKQKPATLSEIPYSGPATPTKQLVPLPSSSTTTARVKWSAAKPCVIGGRSFASKMEARVFERLSTECYARPGTRLFLHVRFPLLSLQPAPNGAAMTFCPDFVIVYPDNQWRVVDAKHPSRVSRDWKRGKAAFEAEYRVAVEEVQE